MVRSTDSNAPMAYPFGLGFLKSSLANSFIALCVFGFVLLGLTKQVTAEPSSTAQWLMNEPVSLLDLGIYRMQRLANEHWNPRLRDALESAGFKPPDNFGLEIEYLWEKDWIRFRVVVEGEATELACKKILEISKTVLFGPTPPSPFTNEERQQIQEFRSRKSELTERELEGLGELERRLELRTIWPLIATKDFVKESRELNVFLSAERVFSHLGGYQKNNPPKEWRENITNMMALTILIKEESEEESRLGKRLLCFSKILSEEMGMVINPGIETFGKY